MWRYFKAAREAVGPDFPLMLVNHPFIYHLALRCCYIKYFFSITTIGSNNGVMVTKRKEMRCYSRHFDILRNTYTVVSGVFGCLMRHRSELVGRVMLNTYVHMYIHTVDVTETCRFLNRRTAVVRLNSSLENVIRTLTPYM